MFSHPTIKQLVPTDTVQNPKSTPTEDDPISDTTTSTARFDLIPSYRCRNHLNIEYVRRRKWSVKVNI